MVSPEWIETGAHNIPAPDCLQSPWSRDNHHGNNMDGFPNTYNWTIPHHTIHKNCVLRLRYTEIHYLINILLRKCETFLQNIIRYNITSGEMNDGGFDSKINASLNAEKENKYVQRTYIQILY